MSVAWPDRLGLWWIAEDRPDVVAIVDSPSGSATFGDLAGRAHQIVHLLRSRGLDDAAVVAAVLPNDVDLLVTSLACQEAGWYFLPLNWHLTPAEVSKVLEHAVADALIVDGDLAADLAPSVEVPRSRRFVVGQAEGFDHLEVAAAEHPTSIPDARRPGAVFSYTSGTTGAPKGIRRVRPEGDPSEALAAASVFGRAFGFRPHEGCHLVSASMHHVGTMSFLQGALNVGQGLVILPRFDAEPALAAIDQHRVTTAYMVPTMFHRLLQLPGPVRARYDHSSLEVVVHSAGPCPRATKQAMFEWWGPVIWETYGGAESPATIAKPHRWLERPGTVGRSIRGVKVTVLDDDGNEVPAGEEGLVYLEPDAAPFEYHGDAAATDAAFRGRRFTLGDIGRLDDDGYLFIVDRAKDVIISGGVNIYPAEAEAVLLGHPLIVDATVLGLPDQEWGERAAAIVVVRQGVDPSDELGDDLLRHCRAQLAHFKCPREVHFRPSLPRTDAGKLYKRHLRDELVAARTTEEVS